MLTLAVDTSGKTASVALAEDSTLLGLRMVYTARAHSQILLPMVKSLLADTSRNVADIDVFAAANGPGSYTGLRIGVAAVQAMAFAQNKQCAGISTLEGLAWNLCGTRGILCAAMAARQNLLYAAFFESNGRFVHRLTDDAILTDADCAAQINAYSTPVTIVGDGIALLGKLTPNIIPAPMHLALQSAAGICMASMQHVPVSPAKLMVRYLQEVKIG